MIVLIYALGVVFSAIYLIIWEYNVGHNKDLRNVTSKEWIQDMLFSLLSWVGFILCILVTIYVRSAKLLKD